MDTKQKVSEYWHRKLSQDADLPSLAYLQPRFLSLSSPHPIFITSLDGNPYQAKAARIQSLFISGRYRTEELCRFWSQNKEGFCLLDSCKNLQISENIEHVLLRCGGLTETRRRLIAFTKKYIADEPDLKPIVETYLFSQDDTLSMQFLMDCSVLPLAITTYQEYGAIIHQDLFRVSRTWCRSVHVARLKALGRYCKVWRRSLQVWAWEHFSRIVSLASGQGFPSFIFSRVFSPFGSSEENIYSTTQH